MRITQVCVARKFYDAGRNALFCDCVEPGRLVGHTWSPGSNERVAEHCPAMTDVYRRTGFGTTARIKDSPSRMQKSVRQT
jgi:hypothetical protein